MKIQEDELMLEGREVYKKEYTASTGDTAHFNWVCIAQFHHHYGLSPEAMAQVFYDSIVELNQ